MVGDKVMNEKVWTKDQLIDFAKADDFRVSPFYDDHQTYGTPTWIWSVVVDDRLFIRAWNGQNSRWYRSAVSQKAGKIFLAGANHEVIFKKLTDDAMDSLVDQEYQHKYHNSPYLAPMIAAGPKSTTMEIVPNNAREVNNDKANNFK